ncbi:MAG: hypothetical protein CVT77_02200 [Alphaproteobacteria bacterium HGW-Alphaproteobacteria-16]|nr:MAG: hypothetical protein CVT77_02200 [Alphaproteobacteria bacterium HGW-Alphaproteobacteria-16]
MYKSLIFALATCCATGALAQTLTVAPHLASNMVVQRDQPIELRGTARAGERVSASFGGTTREATAASDGGWRLSLPAQPGGRSGDVSIRTASGGSVTLSNVVAGDVWLCSGQSNMDLTVASSANPERTAREAAGTPIRVMKVRRTAVASARTEIDPEIPWSIASPENVGQISAACWHMARELVAKGVEVPIGLIHASWGGTTIEDWMPPAALRSAGTDAAALTALADYGRDPDGALARMIEATDAWAARNDAGSKGDAPWAAATLDMADWKPFRAPGHWERSGIRELAALDGVMWFRRTLDLSAAQATGEAKIRLGRIDERDRVWINGKPVGATLIASALREYAVPAGVLKTGVNTIAVRVIDEAGGGGFGGPDAVFDLTTGDGARVPLAGDWSYRIGSRDSEWSEAPPFVPWAAPRGLAMAWNGMIAPLQGVRLKGVAWYQGESNTSRASAYAGLLRAWRTAWRTHFGDAKLPMLVVQLPGYGPMAVRPVDAPWAGLREAQRVVALEDATTGLVVTIDQGVPSDIHPAHKDVVGARMGREALRVAYGNAMAEAPQPIGVRRIASGVAIAFSHAERGLLVYGAADPVGFELCDEKGQCRFARARLAGEAVTIATDDLPVAEIRYGWQGSPVVNLFARSGLPVTPFRIAVP